MPRPYLTTAASPQPAAAGVPSNPFTAPEVLRPRGVYVEPSPIPGKVMLIVHDSTGECISKAQLARRVCDRRTKVSFAAWLDTVDPPALLRIV